MDVHRAFDDWQRTEALIVERDRVLNEAPHAKVPSRLREAWNASEVEDWPPFGDELTRRNAFTHRFGRAGPQGIDLGFVDTFAL
jgi:hypothetical protein